MTNIISTNDRIIPTIRKHVIAEEALPGGGEGVGIEEAGCGGIIVAGLEVIELCFGVVDIAPIGEGVEGTEGVL